MCICSFAECLFESFLSGQRRRDILWKKEAKSLVQTLHRQLHFSCLQAPNGSVSPPLTNPVNSPCETISRICPFFPPPGSNHCQDSSGLSQCPAVISCFHPYPLQCILNPATRMILFNISRPCHSRSAPSTTHKWPACAGPGSSLTSAYPSTLCFLCSSRGSLCQTCFCLRAFALAVPAALNTFF